MSKEQIPDARTIEALLTYERGAMVGRLLRGLVHNISGALQMVRLPVDLIELRSQASPDLDLSKELDTMHSGISRATKELELLSAKSSQSRDLDKGPLELALLIGEQLAFWPADMYFKHEVNLKTSLCPEEARVDIGYADISLAFNALMANALEALEESAKTALWVDLAREENNAVLTVSDEAPAPGPEAREFMFAPFYGTKGGGHSGLGLFLARYVIQRAGGDVTYREAARKGFQITLPLLSD